MGRFLSAPGIERVLLAGLFLFSITPLIAATSDISDLPKIVTHDNLKSGGQLKDGVLTIHLEVKEGAWHPDGDDAPGLAALGIAEEGGAPSVPGPMIRVPEGTRVHVSFKDPQVFPVVVHGLHERPGKAEDVVTINPGETKELEFLAGVPGTYFYNVTCFAPVPIFALATSDTTMTGAFIVDGKDTPTDDRVLMIGLWYNWLVPFDFSHGFREIVYVNGKSWPNTTKLSYTVGDTAHWRVINPSVGVHPMHLHGAHFRVDSAGDGEKENIYPKEQQRLAVTESMQPGRTMMISWTPTHAGNWIFHCHLALHFDPELGRTVSQVMNIPEKTGHEHHEAGGGMAGLVVGVEVHPRNGEAAEVAAKPPQRKLTLTIAQNPPPANSTRRCISVELKDGTEVAATAHGSELGPPIILYRNQPTEITIVNKLGGPTAIHWHGIELESYYDGVPGYGGDSRQVTPPIAPGESFSAHMTPPRAGTYIYHTHWHDVDQLTTGLYGPLIVLEPGEKYDPEQDRVFVVSRAGRDLFKSPMLMNGSPEPGPMQLRVGEKYRLRFINITPSDDEVEFSLKAGDKPVLWQPLAKDGADLPPFYKKACDAKQKFGAGETYDYVFQPETAGKLQLLTQFFRLKTVVPIDVVDVKSVSKK
jgi:FtsP/CotA-like multicopper oxidase with cupredoxin domain